MTPTPSPTRAATPPGLDNRVVAGTFDGTWAQLGHGGDLPSVAAVLAGSQQAAAATVAAYVSTHDARTELLLASPGRVPVEDREQLRRDGFALVDDGVTRPPIAAREPDPGRVWLLTSGTTGRPKRVPHTLAGLTTVAGEQPPRRWLCPYTPGAYAWWQVVTLSLAHPGQDVVFAEPERDAEWPTLALDHDVDAVSGTPTFWRQALLRDPERMARLPLRQVTLGGEPVDQAVLDRLAALYPAARISWIYASSEAGAAIAVHDGLAGFPAVWLGREVPDRARLEVRDGELHVASPVGAAGFDGLRPTGDRAEIHGDRVHVTGRVGTDEINVGGSKVSAASVRAVLLAHPAVAWAQVRGRRAPVVGQLVSADVVLTRPAEIAELTAWSAARLPEHAVPRRLRVLDAIPLRESLKSDA
ncbi:AMP-binding protein [Pedococcus bigeumensis]|uniref:AMP-binding protein n=1 Tax=Pedococcus bigeumensis TaxID=433644 RepID=UPI001F4FD1B3|nr:AMP-binding protein [Pedococcus bigeumensis]